VAYTDGSCYGNGKRDSIGGIGVYFGDDDPRNVSEPLHSTPSQPVTNNRAELMAIVHAVAAAQAHLRAGGHVLVRTDSEYAIKCATTYGSRLAQRGWDAVLASGDVPNAELVRSVFEMLRREPLVRLEYVRAHTGGTDLASIGNARADALARKACGLPVVTTPHDRVFLDVPYAARQDAKRKGALWDKRNKKWYVPATMTASPRGARLVECWGLHSGTAPPHSQPSATRLLKKSLAIGNGTDSLAHSSV